MSRLGAPPLTSAQPDTRHVLAAAFACSMAHDPIHAQALRVFLGRLEVVLGQLDLLRRLSLNDMPDWYRSAGAQIVSESASAEVALVAVALRDAQLAVSASAEPAPLPAVVH